MAQSFEIIDAFRRAVGRDPTPQELANAADLSVGQLNDSANINDVIQRSGSNASSYIAAKQQEVLLKAIANKDREIQGNIDKYLENNPLALDDSFLEQTRQLVKEQVIQEPYFKEKLSNYLEDVETQRERAQEDTDTLINELNRQQRTYETTEQLQFQEARELALEGQTDTGLLGRTGEGQRQLNQQGIARDIKLEDYLSGVESRRERAETGLERTQQDLALGEKRFTTDLEREKQLRTEQEIQQRKAEELDRRTGDFRDYYLRETGGLSGINAYL